MLPFTREELDLAVEEKRVYARRHPTLPLTIYNYSDEVAFGGWWNPVTLTCRGLILDDDFQIVARPWAKFFNLGQRDNEIAWDAPVEVTDKLDGSLGILYPDGDGGGIATRGSFESDQAKYATREIWKPRYSHMSPLPGITMLFEIIIPWNRIVVNYGQMEDLVLLGAVDNVWGYYYGPNEAKWLWEAADNLPTYGQWPGPVAEVFEFDNFNAAIEGWPHREGKEGVVVRSGDKMVKMKQPDYLELHKLVTNATPLNVWRQLKEGHSGFAIVSNFPDEFHDYIWNMVEPLQDAFNTRLDEILFSYQKMMLNFKHDTPRKDIAKVFSKYPDKHYYFLLLDSRPVRTLLWGELRPREEPRRESESIEG